MFAPMFYIFGLAPGSFLVCRRQAYCDAGGFDESMFCAEEVAFAQQLKRRGRSVILREFVITSPRKLRTRTAWDLIKLSLRIGSSGQKGFRERDDYWYGPRE